MPRLPGFPENCTITVDGAPLPARRGEPVASAALAAGRPLLARSAKYHRPRGPFCLAGSCGSCLVRAHGLPNQRACRTPCEDGLAIETQNALPSARYDLLGLVDRLTPRGLDHHHLQTWSRLANRAAVSISRRLAGLGRLPDPAAAVPAGAAAPGEERWDALVVGSGPAGLAAAERLAEAGRRVLLAEAAPRAGGRLRARLPGAPPAGWADEVARTIAAAGGELATGAAVLGLWHDGGSPLAVLHAGSRPPRLRLVRAARILLCPGGHPQPPGLPGDDRPGVLAARGALAALAEDGVVPGTRLAVVGDGPERDAALARLAAAGLTAEPASGAVAVAGRARVRAVLLRDGRIRCDAVLAAGPPAAAIELGRHLGAKVGLDPASGAHALRVDASGRTGVPGLLAAGEVTGAMDAATAAEAGRRAGDAAR